MNPARSKTTRHSWRVEGTILRKVRYMNVSLECTSTAIWNLFRCLNFEKVLHLGLHLKINNRFIPCHASQAQPPRNQGPMPRNSLFSSYQEKTDLRDFIFWLINPVSVISLPHSPHIPSPTHFPHPLLPYNISSILHCPI